MEFLEKELRSVIEGEVHFDEMTCSIYSVDASIFEIKPLGIVVPKNKQDLQRAVEIAAQHRIPVTVRGAATGITGGCLGQGLILDLSKYLNRIHTINIEEEYVICEPGVIQDDLNQALASAGYRLGPDTSTGNRATLGGMLANNSAGARSLRYGKMSDHVESVDLLLANGKTLTFSSISEEDWMSKNLQNDQEGEIYRTLWKIREEDQEEIDKRFPNIPRRVSGYNLNELIKPLPFNIAKLIAGSEGTLGIATEIRMHIVPKPRVTGLLLIFFDNLLEAFRQVPDLLTAQPLSFELIDEQIIQLGRASPSLRNRLDWIKGNPKAILILEIEESTSDKVESKIKNLVERTIEKKIGYFRFALLQPKEIENVWNLRKSGLGILLSKRTYSRAIAFLEDLSLPAEQLAPFMERFCHYLASQGKEAGIYGHVGSGCMHIRPYVNLSHPGELELIRQMMLDVSSLLLEFGGALSGEHGDGWIRSWLNPKMFGDKIMQAFRQIKNVFDPLNVMNPGKIIPLTDEWQDLRVGAEKDLQSPQTFLDFTPEGGFELAADLCNGNGLCRKKDNVMCPSFQATRDEYHSTRARAQALRSIIHKRLPLEAFTSQALHDVMDLCLSCKGCKTECPSQIDMAKFKSEFLYHYQQKHGYSLRSRLFGHISLINRCMSPFARFFNWMNERPMIKKGLEKIGISAKRTLPLLAIERFSSWFANHLQSTELRKSIILETAVQEDKVTQCFDLESLTTRGDQPLMIKELPVASDSNSKNCVTLSSSATVSRIVLLNDTFTEFNHPEVGQATVRLLNAFGYSVILASYSCCGRPALSKGLLSTAQKQAEHLIDRLWPYAHYGYSIIGLEPSCLLTLKDDYTTLLQPKDERIKRLKQILSQCLTLDEFLADLVDKGEFKGRFQEREQQIKVHGHCYQKALVGMKPTLKVLQAVPGFKVEEIPSGCCGMAGSFGYEKEHNAISMKIGELRLFPAVRASEQEDWIIANGMSCRHQIKDGTGRKAIHLAEALERHLRTPFPSFNPFNS